MFLSRTVETVSAYVHCKVHSTVCFYFFTIPVYSPSLITLDISEII